MVTVSEPQGIEEQKTKEITHYCVISHTHWDREWYLTAQQMRVRLTDLIDHLLDIFEEYPAYVFHLDAQTIVLEDYLQIRPHRRALLEKHIRERRLLVGPWYVQNDFFLTSGEATIRNLLIGTALAREFGYCSQVGYVPDQFGLISQLPQILNGFGLRECIFGRGYKLFKKDEQGQQQIQLTPNEFEWDGADRSPVLAVLMRQWYNNAQRFPADPERAARYLRLIDQALRPTTSTNVFLLMNGVDHLEAQENLLPILDALNHSLEEAMIRQTSLENYLKLLRESLTGSEVPRVSGEMRHGTDEDILQGTLSSRAYLKRLNVRAQALLENQIEPLYSMLAFLGEPQLYPGDYLDYLWKSLIKLHPHDSICGCSRDEVHAHMEDDFARIEECARTILDRGLESLSLRIDRNGLSADQFLLTVVNPLKETRSGVVTAEFHFPIADRVTGYDILDPNGRRVEFELLSTAKKKISYFSPINLPGEMLVESHVVRLFAEDVPGLGYRAYRVQPWARGRKLRPIPKLGAKIGAAWPLILENELLRVHVLADGQVDLHDKERQSWTRDLFRLEDEADLGSSYRFIRDASLSPVAISDRQPDIKALESTTFCQSARIHYRCPLPDHYDFKNSRRSVRRQVNEITMTLTLQKGARRLDLDVSINNRSRDHRLRLLINTGLETNDSFSSSPFDIVRRDRREIQDNACQDKCQPNGGLVYLEQGPARMSIFTEGLFEYEHLDNGRGSVAMTLLRANGVIYHNPNDLSLPEEWLAPGNQSLGRTHYRLAVMPGPSKPADPENAYRDFLVPLLHRFDGADPHKFVSTRHCVQDTSLQETFYRDPPADEVHLPLEAQAARITGKGIVLSAIKKAQSGEMWILRLFNPYEEPQTATMDFNLPIARARLMELNESVCKELAMAQSRLVMELPPKKIMTIGLTPGRD